MPLPTITGVPPEIWEDVMLILQQFGVTVWDLTQQGITTWEGAGGLKEYLANNGWELRDVWELKKMWFYTGAGDATQSNALVQYLANKITLAGAAGSQYVKHFSFGGSTMSKLKNGVVFGAIFSLLVSSLDPSFITDALKGRLNAVIDRFADENDEVPVIVGEDGKTYYHEDMINALRQALIDEGVYDVIQGAKKDTTTQGLNYSCVPDSAFPIQIYPSDTLFYYGCLDRPNISGNRYNVKSNVIGIRFNEYLNSTRVNETLIFASDNPNILVYDSWGNTSPSQTSYTVFNATYNNKTVYYCYVSKWADTSGIDLNLYENIHPSFLATAGLPDSNKSTLAWLMVYNAGGEGVEGINVSEDLIRRGIDNIATSLEDIFPSYATDKITTINPSDEDINGHENWYPISTADTDVWTDGITEQQSETATDGEVTPDIQTQLADAIKQILEDYYRDPTDPSVINYPKIPAGDSGDTPPENPPLIPPSDVTGSNGLWSIYNPSLRNVNDFGAWLWSDSLADQFKRIFNSPIDGVIGFHMLYCTPSTGTAKPIKCGFLQSPVSAPVVTNPYVEINCGTVSINEYYRNAMDYDNTRISVYLPFIGIVPLDTNIVMGSDINITYRVDVLTGTCLAQIKVIKENSDAVMYAFDGNCAVQIPLTATTYTGMIGALLGGISAGASIMTGNMVQAIGSGMRALASGMTGLSGAKQSGTFGANVGALGIRIPYVIITHPISAMPGQFNKLEGIPSNNAVVLGSLSGYTRVRSVHLENIGNATQEEIQMIQEQLEQGVII